ncbi:hypothetical protein NPIL_344051 [Nephila pilipes]|uniref:Uncharacterized protein n=1 Tax=Nephila pilipes TaxID=299642 RepID=A0A8X6PMI5_NEPPI|nr:hypothetical protein NPIL_344051 [Nephila pilipes]
MQRFTDSPSINTRVVTAECDVPVWNVLQTANMYSFQIQKVQLLTEEDNPRREQFASQHIPTHNFLPLLYLLTRPILREDIISTHNAHM